MANVVTLAGTIISVSANTPATYDSAGFSNVAMVYTPVGEVTNLGSRGRTYQDVSFTTLAERGTVHMKGTFDEPETTFDMVSDRTDAGQIIMKTASGSDSDFAFKLVYQNGEIDYFLGKVFSFVTNGGDANAVRSVSANIRIDRRGVVEA